MDFDELMRRIREADPLALPPEAAGVQVAQARLVQATLKALSRAASDFASERLVVPGLGSFRPWPEPPDQPAAPRRLIFVPEASVRSMRAEHHLWEQALKAVMRPLIHPERRFVVVFSAKSACSSVVIWFLHTLGLAAQARAYNEWPHLYRIDKLYQRPDYLDARDRFGPGDVTVLRIARDPIERAASSFRHALGTGYAREAIGRALGVDTDLAGLSFERYIDFLETEDLDRCDPHHRRQKHPLEAVRRPDVVINTSRQDLFDALRAFERDLGMPPTDFAQLPWIHELQASRMPRSVPAPGDPYRLVLTREQAQKGPWPLGLITPQARSRLERLYQEDIQLYGTSDTQ
ncbi:MAG TPA: hypothetical protein VGQ91_07730 [Ideonella sp.]|jgi:hypothetical protein|nr:hypothetical protein [Ideonella sp.]